jgi:nitroreductase
MARSPKSVLMGVKTRLQFTGWLQYILPAVLATICFVVALLGWAIGVLPALFFWPPLILGSTLLLVDVIDVITLKVGLRPAESRPSRRDETGIFDLMAARRSCRSFQIRDLTPADHAELMERVRLETQPDRQIGQRPIRFEYVAAPLTVWPVVNAREFLVAIAPKQYDRLAVIDVGRSLEKVVIHATRMGLATCWIGPGADHDSILRHLGARFDVEQDHIICVCAVGYASRFAPLLTRIAGVAQHRRLPLTSLFFADPQFQKPLDTGAALFAQFDGCYEACQSAPSAFNGQPTRCAGVMVDDGVLPRFDFAASTTSRFYAAVALGIWCANWELGCEALEIAGHFSVLTPEERGMEKAPELPHYDVSWTAEPAAA